MDRAQARKLIETYGKAWVEQDIELILSIYHEDASFGEYLLKEEHVGHEAIAKYWREKVVEEQSDISFKIINLYTENTTIIAEWDVSFNSSLELGKRIHLVSVGIFETKNGKISKSREYWHSERL